MYSLKARHSPSIHNTIITINDMSIQWHHLISSPYSNLFPKCSLWFSSHPRLNPCFCITYICHVALVFFILSWSQHHFCLQYIENTNNMSSRVSQSQVLKLGLLTVFLCCCVCLLPLLRVATSNVTDKTSYIIYGTFAKWKCRASFLKSRGENAV